MIPTAFEMNDIFFHFTRFFLPFSNVNNRTNYGFDLFFFVKFCFSHLFTYFTNVELFVYERFLIRVSFLVEAEFLICDTEKKVKTILDSKESIPKLRHIIAIQEVSEEIKQLAAQKEVTLHRFKDIEVSSLQNYLNYMWKNLIMGIPT